MGDSQHQLNAKELENNELEMAVGSRAQAYHQYLATRQAQKIIAPLYKKKTKNDARI
ncbi:hypothetical protein PALB_27990 [Pseudoalteromonas luteoviolacea B = ATCC 29581]|nr:hypothetical protein PALB_27990 [Pseudoalteromonas luteoviolacea B = ATCC 29581]